MDDLAALIGALSTFLDSNLVQYLVAFLALSGAAAQLAALTPWGWDDKLAGPLQRLFSVLAGNWGKAKSLPKG